MSGGRHIGRPQAEAKAPKARRPFFECGGAERCDVCNAKMWPNGECPSCELYNAAIAAQKEAAHRIAKSHTRHARRAWLNSHGVFAWVHGKAVQVGSPEQAAPFVALTTAARRVTTFFAGPVQS